MPWVRSRIGLPRMGDLKVWLQEISHRGGWYHHAANDRESHVLVTRSDGLHASFDDVNHAVI